MKFILILVTTMSSSMTGNSISVALAEFDDQYSCQQAGKRAEQMIDASSPWPGKKISWDCMPKGATAR